MAKGRPTKWVTVTVAENIYLGKSGITVYYWNKHQKYHRAKIIISVGGIRWYTNKAKKYYKRSWDELEKFFVEG